MDAATDSNAAPASTEPATNSFSNEYWNSINPIYPQTQAHEQSFGIGWDHPVFHQQHTSHPPPASQTPDLYVHSQQPWPQTSLQHALPPEPDQTFELQNQYSISSYTQPQQAPQHQQHAQHPQQTQRQSSTTPAYDNPQPNHSFPAYSFDNAPYYQNVIPPHNGYPPQPPVDLQRSALQNVSDPSLESRAPPYPNPPPPLPQNIQPRPPSFSYHPQAPNYQSTIDPQYLTAARYSFLEPEQPQINAFVVNPADLDRSAASRGHLVSNQFGKPLLAVQNADLIQAKLPNIGISPVPHPGKPLQPRKKKEALIRPAPLLKDSQQESDSDSSDSELEIEEPPEPSPLPLTPPTDLDGRTKYEATKIVWFPRNRQPSAPAIRNAMVLFSDLVKGIRDVWKLRSEALKAAENQNQDDKIPAIKREVIMQRRLLEMVINTTLQNGHPSYIQRFGEHPIIVSACYSFLLDRHTAADSDGSLTVTILKLMARFTTMDQAMLEKTKNDKILIRFVKKGGEVIKKLARTILDNAGMASKNKTEPLKPAPREDQSRTQISATKESPEASQNLSQANAKKRLREIEESNGPPPKRMVSPPNAKLASKLPGPNGTGTQRGTPTNSDSKPGVQNANKGKANIVTPKPTASLFSSLMSASKKPGTSNAARAAAAAAAKEKAKAEPNAPQPPPRPAFSFSETLAGLSEPKEAVSTKLVEEVIPETEEEKAKRLRKESRRKLRVSWKPEDSLVEIRLFTHDPEEEIGRDDSARRDVSDLAGEGRTLKMHRGLDDIDDEDDDDLLTYYSPSEIDFTVLEAADLERNFLKTGGGNIANSPSRVDQEHREATTLSVFYSSPSEVPISPKEPPNLDKEEESYEPEENFGQPEAYIQNRSAKYFASMAAIAAKNAGIRPQSAPPVSGVPNSTPTPQAPPQPDISTLLQALQQNKQPQAQVQQQQQPQTQPQNNMTDLERIFSQFRDPSQVPTPPLANPITQAAPSPAPAAPGFDLQKLLGFVTLHQQMQQMAGLPQAQTSQGPDLAAVLAQLNAPAQQGQQPDQQTTQHFGFNQQQGPAPYENPERKRYRETGERHDHDENVSHGHKRFRGNSEPGKPKKHPKAGLVPCRYWKEGKCLKGSDCTFRHDPLD